MAGLAVCGLGLLLLLDSGGGLELRLGVAGPLILAAVGAVLLASGLGRER